MVEAAGQPAEAAAGIRHAPMWPVLEAITHTIAYDGQVMGNTQNGDPATLARYAGVTIPALVMVGGDSLPHHTEPWRSWPRDSQTFSSGPSRGRATKSRPKS